MLAEIATNGQSPLPAVLALILGVEFLFLAVFVDFSVAWSSIPCFLHHVVDVIARKKPANILLPKSGGDSGN